MMKKFIVSLLVLSAVLFTASAAVDFSGELVAGYAFQYNDEWTNHIMGQDGEDTNTTSLNLSIADDGGIWSVGIEGFLVTDESGAVSGDVSVDLAKLIAAAFGNDTNWSLDLSLLANDRLTAFRAYSMQKNLDRIRTENVGLWTSLTLGYGDFASIMVAGSPKTVAVDNDFNDLSANNGDLMVSAIVNPLSGLSVSAGYVLNGDTSDSGIDRNNSNADGIIGASADINIAELVGLDFGLGIGLSEKYDFGGENNIFVAAVYGAFDPVGFELQYGLKNYGDDTTEHFVYAGVDVTAVENMLLDAYFGAYNAAEFNDSWFVGADIGYTISDISFKLGVEYGAGTSYNYDDSYYKTSDSGAGLWIVPSVSVAW